MDDCIQIIEDGDNDAEVIIIDNPNPKPPAPVVILFDSDDDDVSGGVGSSANNKIIKENEKKDSTDSPQKMPMNLIKNNSSEIISLDDSETSCIRINDALMNNKNEQMKEWYKKYKCSSTACSPQSANYYTCPECLAAFSSFYMIDKHIKARHPKSIHIFQKNNNPGCTLRVLSDSKSLSPQKCNSSSNLHYGIDCEVATQNEDKNHSSVAQRLKLTPLQAAEKRTLTYDNQSDKRTLSHAQSNCDLYIPLNLPPLSTKRSQDDVLKTSISTNTKSAKKPTGLPSLRKNISETLPSSTNLKNLEPLTLPCGKPLMSISTSNKSSESSKCPEIRKPLTVVIFSPNDSSTQDRMVRVSPGTDGSRYNNYNKMQDCIEVNSTDDDSALEDNTVQVNSLEDNRTHDERVIEFNLNKNRHELQNKRRNLINNGKKNNWIQGSSIVVMRNHKRDRAQKTVMINKKSNTNSNNISRTNDSNSDGTSNESTKEASQSLLGKILNRKRRDPLLILTDGDSIEQSIPEKRLKGDDLKSQPSIKDTKKFICQYCRKRFTTISGKINHIKDKHLKQKDKKEILIRRLPTLHASTNPPALDKLSTMKHIVMIDVDNWTKIFESDLKFAPSTFVWAFHGGATSWCPPPSSVLLRQLQELDCFYLHPKCGNSKDAADFALCVQAGKLDVQLPKEIPFTVLSGDKGFRELQNQLNLSKREVHIVNPHHKTLDTVLTILNSIADK